ncbi:MAG: cupin domain-containing protein [Actinomycetota bacterium]|nr:cupin domain-containing protein [Actinomycetota bacterium]
MTDTAIIRAEGEGERLWFYGGGVFTIKASGAETGGSFFMFEDTMADGKTTPLHLHPDYEEAIYVIEGELLVHCDGENHRLGAGGVGVVPRGVPHALLVTSKIARVLVMVVPGKGEAFFRGASEPATADTDASGPVDFDRLRHSAERNGGLEILGPPPFNMSQAVALARSNRDGLISTGT